ncbi:MAG: NUDIX domain-containing protein [Bacilli bacterium]|nr:NUDIX domain-containing protein [Bacilli bacterium]MBQ8902401.1 NUDIX domain-containing protein [Bacilli bacterium]
MEKLKRVVGVAFVEDGKLLIVRSVRSSATNSWTLVGGGIESGETEITAALREVNEEVGQGFEFCEEDLLPIMCFKEAAASDSDVTIEMNMFLALKQIHVSLIPNDEILDYHWYKLGDVEYNLASSIRDHFLPYAIQKGLIF